MAPQASVTFTSMLLVTFLSQEGVQGQQNPPSLKTYDFWDDSGFDDIFWEFYNGSATKNFKASVTAEECADACEADQVCTSFIYNDKTKDCDHVPVVLILNDAGDDPRIKTKLGNRLYRYHPPGLPLDRCPIEKCFYYDRKANACWKLMYNDGPRKNGRYKFPDAKNACIKMGGRLAVLDTEDKFHRAILMLVNNPAIVKTHVWRKVWVGARRLSSGQPILWLNGANVTQNNEFWDRQLSNIQKQLEDSNKHCLSFSPVGPSKRPNGFRFRLNNCNELYLGMICEIP